MEKDTKKKANEDKKDKKVEKTKNKNTKKQSLAISATLATVVTAVLIIVVLLLNAYVLNTIVKKQNFTAQNPIATIEIENYGTIKVELYPEYAPNTVSNFIKLANNGFYNGLTFHRTIPEFMIQGGDPNGDGTGSATLDKIGSESTDAYAVEGEFILNGFTKNTLKHERGTLSMARSDYTSYSSSLATQGYNSGSSQFFIVTEKNESLDGSYAAFGKVIEGMDVVDKISNVEVETRDSNTTENLTADKPIDPPVIKTITVETYGVDYGTPKTMTPFDYYSYMMQQYYGSSSATQY